jgi:hypothetical protein
VIELGLLAGVVDALASAAALFAIAVGLAVLLRWLFK